MRCKTVQVLRKFMFQTEAWKTLVLWAYVKQQLNISSFCEGKKLKYE